ncbi:MAG: dienelactone hydrolase family protein [Alphaproteobacteria bacterium]|nr:dienelactone hydrolase family protein [Alphaproteobacteria bacterium]
MIERKIEIPTINTQTLLLTSDGVVEFPGVVFLTDIWGIRPANIGMAKRLAEKGFAVLMPNVFHRYSRITPDGFEPKDETEKHKTLQALFGTLTADQMVSDGKAYVDFLLAQKGVKPGKIGVVGHCFTGQMAVRMAAAVPDRIAAAASFHGGFLVTDKPDSPHKILPPIKARLYFGHAMEDSSATPEQIATLEEALRNWHGAFQSEVYEGARHGWTVPGRDVHNELQAERAFEKEVELFDAALK